MSKPLKQWPPLDRFERDRISKTVGAMIQSRANGCLNAAWAESAGFAIVDQIEMVYALVKKG